MKDRVGRFELQDIDALVAKVLRDLGLPDPPLDLSSVGDLLTLDLKYYSTADVSAFQEIAHRIRVAGKRIAARPLIVLDVLKKAKLSGLWLPDDRRIFIDQEQPPAKHRWIHAHEITHSLIPWHAKYLLGDNDKTLAPECHATIEAEANYGAGRLIFLGDQFAADARDLPATFGSVQTLSKRYGNTLTSTLWRFVEDRDPDVPTFGVISQHPRYPSARREDPQVEHFVTSAGFKNEFRQITPDSIYAAIARNVTWKRRGPVMTCQERLVDSAGSLRPFSMHGFCNTYHVLTYGRLV